MKLYLLKRMPEDGWYDEANGFVVRAKSPRAARELAAEQCGDEGRGTWLNASTSTCMYLTDKNGTAGVIMRDFSAG